MKESDLKMGEYISREAAVEKITFLCELREIVCSPDDEFLRGLKNALNAVKSNDVIPSADVQPVKCGKWSRLDYDIGHDYVCSVCKCKNDRRSRFCPDCGADMRTE